jgi:hypothetical protein
VIPSSGLVIGCSEQLPNELLAYHLVGASSDGVMLLSRHGATYSAARGEISAYPALLERMLGLVLENIPVRLRDRARVGLISRWNRDWGVEAEDLAQLDAAPANDNGSGFASETVETSPSPFEVPQPTIDIDGALEPRTALAANQRAGRHG